MLMALHPSVEVHIQNVTQLGEVSLSVTGALQQVPRLPRLVALQQVPRLPQLEAPQQVPRLPRLVALQQVPRLPQLVALQQVPRLPQQMVHHTHRLIRPHLQLASMTRAGIRMTRHQRTVYGSERRKPSAVPNKAILQMA